MTMTYSDEEVLSKIRIRISNFKKLRRQIRPYYRTVVQCLRNQNFASINMKIDSYEEAIQCLCIVKDFLPIKRILEIPIFYNNDTHNFIELSLSEYLLLKGFYKK